MPSSATDSGGTTAVQSQGTFHPFSRLPVELQRQIWDLTLVPRTLTVYECYVTVFSKNPSHTPISHYQKWVLDPHPTTSWLKTLATAERIWPDLRPTSFWANPRFRQIMYDHFILNNHHELFPNSVEVNFEYDTTKPNEPAASRVCQMSREMALRRYQFAFGTWHSTSSQLFSRRFEESGLRRKRVWIDWRRDTILVQLSEWEHDASISYNKIRNLAVVADRRWYDRGSVRTGIHDEAPWDECLLLTLEHLEHLENLVVYYYQAETDGDISWAERVKSRILDVITNPGPSFPTRTEPLPIIKLPNVKMAVFEEAPEFTTSC